MESFCLAKAAVSTGASSASNASFRCRLVVSAKARLSARFCERIESVVSIPSLRFWARCAFTSIFPQGIQNSRISDRIYVKVCALKLFLFIPFFQRIQNLHNSFQICIAVERNADLSFSFIGTGKLYFRSKEIAQMILKHRVFFR